MLKHDKITFDPKNIEHRKVYRNFLIDQGWKNNQQFYLESPFMNVLAMIQSKLLKHYTDEEFAVKS